MKFWGKTDSFQEFLFELDMVNQIMISPMKVHLKKKDVDNEQTKRS